MKKVVYKTHEGNTELVVDIFKPRYVYFSRSSGHPIIYCDATDEARDYIESRVSCCVSLCYVEKISLYEADIINKELLKKEMKKRKHED